MNKSELIEALSERFNGSRREASHALESVIDVVVRSVQKGEPVAITGFGKFDRRIRPAGTARNPRTGQTVKTKRKAVPKFTPGAEFKAIVSGEKKLAAPPKKTASKTTTKKTTAKKAPAKKTASKRTTSKKATVKRAPARKTTARKAPARKTTARKTATKKTAARKSPARKAPARKAPARKR